ncbi:MAG: hypothetical protein QUS11_04220 [Candidatus Fermentibacter sp.]|nr:hypothetical protein [Candidatus Fermentibacter sp.]
MVAFRPSYEPPIAMDLSGRTAEGQNRGTCMNGTGLISSVTCVTGIAPESGDPDSCRPTGLDPEYGGCDYGHRAANNCISGTSF